MKIVHALILGAFVFAASPAFADTISLVSDPWCPYVCDPDKTNGSEGFMVEIARQIFEDAGHEVVFEVTPWGRAKRQVYDGASDGLVGTSIPTDEERRKKFVFPTVPLGKAQVCFFVKESILWTYEGVKSLAKLRLGVIKDYLVGLEDIDHYVGSNTRTGRVRAFYGDNALQQIIGMMVDSRIDVCFEDHSVIEYTLGRMGVASQIRKAGCLDKIDDMYIGFSARNEKSPEYARILSDGIILMKKSGEFQAILDKYGVHE